MKKIDLHIHTVATVRDSYFEFSIESFRRYVESARIDIVAVTNHDIFDGKQFREIQSSLPSVVFPGIEVSVEKCHILVIADTDDLDDFESKTALVEKRIKTAEDNMSVEEFLAIFGDLTKYLVIPHSDKSPEISNEALQKLKSFIHAGEVDSAKKFVRAIKDVVKLTPVLFSDSRMKVGMTSFSPRQTFVDCGEISLGALKSCLQDKAKVALSESEGNKLWQVFENGQQLSTGLNVLIGPRSSGKTHTLDAIESAVERVKYIKQFMLVQKDDAEYEKDFKSNVEKRRSTVVDDYLSGLKRVVEDVMELDLEKGHRDVEQYVSTLLQSAAEADRQDAFSKAALFDEAEFPVGTTSTLKSLIEAVRHLTENVEHRPVIEKHVSLAALKTLALELIELYREKSHNAEKEKFVNGLVAEIKRALKVRTSATQVEDVDLYSVSLAAKKVDRFNEIVARLKNEAVIFSESLQGFRIEAKREEYSGASEIKATSGTKLGFSDAFRSYSNPFEYLQALLKMETLSRSSIYKLFVKVSYRILNRDGFEVSGGERSEFRLLQEIADAQNYDALLIDEPESSFDNLFLRSDVNQLLKGISETMPVVVVTHNNTVGASVGADYLLYTKKELRDGKVNYYLFSGHPTDKELRSVDGSSISTHDILMNSLEAGFASYEGRRRGYEAVKN